jgi:hypothetical protein
MSYDIFAFDPGVVPVDDDLLAWYRKQAEWSEPHSYDDPAVTTPRLRALYHDLIAVFPSMNGPDAPDDDEDAMTDYCIGMQILYVGFRWSQAEQARSAFIRLAIKHGVGVCEISESPAVIHQPSASDVERPVDSASLGSTSASTGVPATKKAEHGVESKPTEKPEHDGEDGSAEGQLRI